MILALLSILSFFLKALSLYFCCIETIVGSTENTCSDDCLKIFNGLRTPLPNVETLKREKECDAIAELVLQHAISQPTGFGVTRKGQYQWTYAKILKTEDEEVEKQVVTQFTIMLRNAQQKNETFSKDPTSIFPDLTNLDKDSVIILDEHLYSHNQLFGKETSFSLGWAISESHVVTVVVSKITRVTKQGDNTNKVLKNILERSLKNNLDPFVLQFQATNLAQRILSLDTRDNFEGLIEGPGFQASIQIEILRENSNMTDDKVLADMLEEIKNKSKVTENNPNSGNLGDMFTYAYDGFSSEDYQAIRGADNIAFGVYENEKKRISVVLYFNTFTKTIGEIREKFGGNAVFERLKNVSEVKEAVKWIGNNVFQNYSSGFGIFDEKYAISFLKCTKTKTYQFGMEKEIMKSMLDSISIKDSRKEINLKLEKIQDLEHTFTLMYEGNSVADLEQIIATFTNEITPTVIEIGDFYVAVFVTKISEESLKNLPFFVLEFLQKEAGQKLRKRMQQGLKDISEKFMDQTLRHLQDIKTELKIIDEKCFVHGIAIRNEILPNEISPILLRTAVSIKSVEALSKAVSEFPEVFIDCRSNDGLNFVTTFVVYTHPAWKLFKHIKKKIEGLDFSLSLPLTSWATDFAKKYEHMETPPSTFGLTQDNHIVSTINLAKLNSEDFHESIFLSEELEFKDKIYNPYTFNMKDIEDKDYRVIYDRTTSADLFQIFTAKEVGVAHIVRQNKYITIFAYDASSISAGCLLPLINSYRNTDKRRAFGDHDILKGINQGYLPECVPDLDRSPIDVPGLIIHKKFVVTYQVLSDSGNVNDNSSLVEKIFRFGQTILLSKEDETFEEASYVPWTEFNYKEGVKYPSSFLVPNESLKIQKKLILDGKLVCMHLRGQENGSRSIQLFYAHNSKLDEHDKDVGIKLVNADGTIEVKENTAEDTQDRNRIGGSVVRSLARKQLSTPAGYIVFDDCIVAFAKISSDTTDRVELAKLIVDSLMKSDQPLSVMEASTAKNSKMFDYKYTIVTGSGETFVRFVDSAKNAVLGFAYTSNSGCIIGGLCFAFNMDLPVQNHLRVKGHQWQSLHSLNFLANEVASTWAKKNIPGNFAEGYMTVNDQEFVSVVVSCETATELPNLINGGTRALIENLQKRTASEVPIELDPPEGLTGKFLAGGPPTLISELSTASLAGFGGILRKVEEKLEYCFVILIPATSIAN